MPAYGAFALFFLVTVGTVGATLGLNALLGPRPVPSPGKLMPFECGAEPIQQRNVVPLSVRYFVLAIFFLLFDLETVLLFIWAGSFMQREPAGTALPPFLLFMGMLALVFVYLWKEDAFTWR